MATTKIKCPVEGIIDLDRLPGVGAAQVRRVIDAPELQRLRSIKQLGFTELVYPGATHTRFAHSLGAFQGAQRTLNHLRLSGHDIPDEWFIATCLACLVHDLGHGPFSHTFEAVTRVSHESLTTDIMRSGPAIGQAMEDIRGGMAGRVLDLLTGRIVVPELQYLTDLVSSALDCDRMDYLRRDALYTGAQYGTFDRDWLIREIKPTAEGDAIVVASKGRSAVEQYLIGRYHMFQNVYLHKTSRGFETAFRHLCERLVSLGRDAIPADSRAFSALFESPLSVERFLGLSDNAFRYELTALVSHDDATVAALAQSIVGRRPLRQHTYRIDLSGMNREVSERREQALAAGLDPETAVWKDAATDVPYRPYSPREGTKGLRVETHNGLVDITDVSPTIKALSERLVVHRVYWLAAQ